MGGQDGLRADADVSDIFAAERLWRGRLVTTGRLSCRHPSVVCAGRGGKVAVAGRSVAWATYYCLAPQETHEDAARTEYLP